MNLEAAKYQLIQLITEIQSEFEIQKLLNQIKQFNSKPESKIKTRQQELLEIGKQPMPKSISLEELKRSQGYSTKKLREIYAQKDMNIWADENLEELLDAIK